MTTSGSTLDEDIAQALAAGVRVQRARFGLDQGTLAERLGVSRSLVAKIEGGERRVTVGDLAALCRVFEVDARGLLLAPQYLDGGTRERVEAALDAICGGVSAP